MPAPRRSPPTVFISYSWDDDAHRTWVRQFAARLVTDGVKAMLDQWHAVPGDPLPEFMERAIRQSKFVLIVCTPRYKERADKRLGGVGYEGGIMTAEVFESKSRKTQRKFIPILRAGTWEQSAPSWLKGKYRIQLNVEPYSEENYQDLLDTLFDARPKPPELGPPPGKYRVQRLCDDLESSVADNRRHAVEALGRLGSAAKDVAPKLVNLLEDPDYWVRRSALRSLGNIILLSGHPRDLVDLFDNARHAMKRVAQEIEINEPDPYDG